MNQPPSDRSGGAPSGLPYALGAYFIWGLFPLYLLMLRDVPPIEFVGWRIVLTLPVCLLIVAATHRMAELRMALGSPKALLSLAASALLIGVNWLIYVAAIHADHVFAASLGYYINPLVNVLAGTLFLGERLSRPQWAAVALAAAGVSLLAWGAAEMLGIALALAMSFAGYGLVRRLAPVGALIGLTVESLLLMAPAAAILAWFAAGPAGPSFGNLSFGKGPVADVLLAASGAITASALLLFATAARRMDYSTLGFVQYLTPTMVFLFGIFLFDEPLRPVQLACFIAIWAAIALYSWDLWARRRKR